MPENEQEILKEKRNRAPAPTVPHGLYDLAALPKGVDDYLRDRFGLRKQMIGLYANLTKRLFGEGNQLVLVGRHDRMFCLGEDAVRQSAGLVRRDSRVAESADFLAAMRSRSVVSGSWSRRRQTRRRFIRTTCRAGLGAMAERLSTIFSSRILRRAE